MSEQRKDGRIVWSCSLLQLPEETEALRLEERLRSGDSPFWDDAADLREYLRLTGMSQAACARVLGRSQASIANRMRLLRLPEELREKMRSASLTERHARALLRLESGKDREEALEHVIRAGLNVAETEAYVERRLARAREDRAAPEEFEPLLTELERLRRAVPSVEYALREEAGEICFLIRIPKKSI